MKPGTPFDSSATGELRAAGWRRRLLGPLIVRDLLRVGRQRRPPCARAAERYVGRRSLRRFASRDPHASRGAPRCGLTPPLAPARPPRASRVGPLSLLGPLLRRHADRAVEPDHLAIEHLVADDLAYQRGEFGGTAEPLRERHHLAERL